MECQRQYVAVRRFKNSRELFDGYKHKIQMEYVETGVLEGEEMEGEVEGDARPELNVLCQLVVNNVISDDCGEVECRAFNSGGMDSTRAQLFMRCMTLHLHSHRWLVFVFSMHRIKLFLCFPSVCLLEV